MSYSLQELREIPTDELVRQHDATAAHTSVGVTYFLEELARRDRDAHDERMLKLTQTMTMLTWFVAGLTIVNLVFVVTSALD